MTTEEKPLHQTAEWRTRAKDASPFPKPGDKWRPLHRPANKDNKTITIRRFIAGERKKQ